eukprot:GAHX01001926.1.p1 GENE.GAHX01001926.1~~GAHX01001926.1.p1  ORF type:complete len:212 (-),score=39.22 GAHX01001926.1:218-853(-)
MFQITLLLFFLLSNIQPFETSQCGDIFDNSFLELDENNIMLVLNQSLQNTLNGLLLRIVNEELVHFSLQLKENNVVVFKFKTSLLQVFKNFNFTFNIDGPRVETSHDSDESSDNCRIVIKDNRLLRSLLLWGVVERNDLHIMEQLKNLALTITLDIEKKHEDNPEDNKYVVKIGVMAMELSDEEEVAEVLNDVLLLIGAIKEEVIETPVGD